MKIKLFIFFFSLIFFSFWFPSLVSADYTCNIYCSDGSTASYSSCTIDNGYSDGDCTFTCSGTPCGAATATPTPIPTPALPYCTNLGYPPYSCNPSPCSNYPNCSSTNSCICSGSAPYACYGSCIAAPTATPTPTPTRAPTPTPTRTPTPTPAPPAAPTLISPANNATNVSTTPTLSWNSVSGAQCYYAVVPALNLWATTSTSFTVPVTLNNYTSYSWHVIAYSGPKSGSSCTGISSPWSSQWTFTTVAAKICTPGATQYVCSNTSCPSPQ